MPHFGEEPCISGKHGSGTIFFSGCNMTCVYCQNYQFSQLNQGREVSVLELSQFMLELQNLGCHNINLVTPTHVIPQILGALILATAQGLNIPLVYNTSGYELTEVVKLLDGIVDVFLADMRYSEDMMSVRYSKTAEYSKYNQAAIKQMHQQAGIAEFDKSGLINRGLIIRHLVLPNKIAGTQQIMRFIARELSKQTYISLMSQYLPCHKTEEYPELSRRISKNEYNQAVEIMQNCGLSNGWLQESGGMAHLAGTNIKPR
ncbi:MAG: radical SAM protein [Candidatus Omnitrophota bacterium]|jgi:putative pyruvate formate lyase activating enzyme